MQRFWRTLVRVEGEREDAFEVVLPARNHQEVLLLPKKHIPDFILRFITGDTFPVRVYAYVNFGEEDNEKLVYKDWQLPWHGPHLPGPLDT